MCAIDEQGVRSSLQPTRESDLTLRLLDSETQEAERVLSAIAGDVAARSWIVDHYTPPIHRYCLRMLRQPELAQETTQEVMYRALSKLQRFDPQRSFKTWIFSIARNACIDLHRKRRPTQSTDDTVLKDRNDLPDAALDRKTRAQRLNNAVSELPDLYREVILLYHFEHLKYQEIAEALEIPLGTVMNRIFRARQKLRDRLGGVE
ncbi:MAG: sigma-70 family RNA polymerase sigma factor [Myxococcota bacterium]|nr:sigma-70 family RNA polymerase sigma factor [Myxococcota bacterium]